MAEGQASFSSRSAYHPALSVLNIGTFGFEICFGFHIFSSRIGQTADRENLFASTTGNGGLMPK